jgi:predicted DNA-binding protein
MSTLAISLPDELLSSLDKVAKFFDRSKNYVAIKAIKSYIDAQLEEMEDMQDGEICLRRMNDPNRELISWDEAERRALEIRGV